MQTTNKDAKNVYVFKRKKKTLKTSDSEGINSLFGIHTL